MADGTYQVRLILRDRDGHVYRESKSFVIASKTPVCACGWSKSRARAGETVRIAAQASGNAAHHYGAALWRTAGVATAGTSAAKANTGDLVVPQHLPPGKYVGATSRPRTSRTMSARRRSPLKSGRRIWMAAGLLVCGAAAAFAAIWSHGCSTFRRDRPSARCFAASPCRAAPVPVLTAARRERGPRSPS